MAAMASKFNFECVIQYYTDQWFYHYIFNLRNQSLKFGNLPATIKVHHDLRFSIKRLCKHGEYMLR